MTVKLEAEGHDYDDAMRKLGMSSRAPIEIRFRRKGDDYGRQPGTGCVIDVEDEGRRAFETAEAAITYLGELLRKRDDYVTNADPRTGYRLEPPTLSKAAT